MAPGVGARSRPVRGRARRRGGRGHGGRGGGCGGAGDRRHRSVAGGDRTRSRGARRRPPVPRSRYQRRVEVRGGRGVRRSVRRLRGGGSPTDRDAAAGRVPARRAGVCVGVGRRRPVASLAQRAGAAHGEGDDGAPVRSRTGAGAHRRAGCRRRLRAEDLRLSRGRVRRVGGAAPRSPVALDRNPLREHGRPPPRARPDRERRARRRAHGRIDAYEIEVHGRRRRVHEPRGVHAVVDPANDDRRVHDPARSGRACGLVTNTTPTSAYRGAGRPEAANAIERMVDQFAAAIGDDPVRGAPAQPHRRRRVPVHHRGRHGVRLRRLRSAHSTASSTAIDYSGLRAEQADAARPR